MSRTFSLLLITLLSPSRFPAVAAETAAPGSPLTPDGFAALQQLILPQPGESK